ncbi:bifunctional adenosylcobinamide kinase/adenosylcobinamide-phosphate guanylyltransferase [Lacibacterium aquatile]|uniref:Bifunctional adenosylcobalamin biosynthesis protein n=1 Tax=Lacibacterium aquatile TaxID=1168082 RepID=A0ABW5DV26_9PROT
MSDVPFGARATTSLIIGGARSGKSRLAEERLTAMGGGTFIATAQIWDEEMAERISLHRASRPADWTLIEEPHDLIGALDRAEGYGRPILVDCLTLWLSNRLLAGADLMAESRALADRLTSPAQPVLLVTNEVGLAIVPETPLGRRFRDAAGSLNQRLAAIAGDVTLVVAGLSLKLK